MHTDVRADQPASATAGPFPTENDDPWQRRRALRHDIQHEVGTIMLLAGLLDGAADVGPASRRRLGQIEGEVRWLDQLLRAYDETDLTAAPLHAGPRPGYRELIRLDVVADEIATALTLATTTRVTFDGFRACAYVDRLALWRALRNLTDNAVRAAGPAGEVRISAGVEDGRAVVAVDDDGPGFGAAPPGLAGLGLAIARDMVAAFGGTIELRHGRLGGGCVRLVLPAVPGEIG
jgi:signal transduction histidine kinase